MPVEDHPAFAPPRDPNEPIWRYMDFTKFVSVLDRQALFFPSMATLGRIDPFEGSVPKLNVDMYDIPSRNLTIDQIQKIGFSDYDEFEKYVSLMKTHDYRTKRQRLNQCLRKVTFVNSWHMNRHESAAMWTVYSNKARGIALVSSYDKLRASLMNASETMYIGQVIYIDYSRDYIPEGNTMLTAVHKRMSFAHERELRTVVTKTDLVTVSDEDGGEKFDYSKPVDIDGIYVECSLGKLIQEIVVSPLAPHWYYELVGSICKKYNFDVCVRRTDLDTEPVF